jgi:hypothetical protein
MQEGLLEVERVIYLLPKELLLMLGRSPLRLRAHTRK